MARYGETCLHRVWREADDLLTLGPEPDCTVSVSVMGVKLIWNQSGEGQSEKRLRPAPQNGNYSSYFNGAIFGTSFPAAVASM